MAESSCNLLENAAGKGEIAPNEQFLLFPLCFQKTCTAGLVYGKCLTLYQTTNFRLVQIQSICRQESICS